MGLSFQMIFSIILIAIFLYAAFTGISYFLERADQAKLASFVIDLESKSENMWQATEASQTYSFTIPNSLKYVCFGDITQVTEEMCPNFGIYKREAGLEGANMLFCPPDEAMALGTKAYFKLDCSGNECLEFYEGVYCVPQVEGKVSINLRKEFGGSQVILS